MAEPAGDDYLVADGLSLSSSDGPVFSDVTFSFPRGRLAVIDGPAGSGRSALLLAIGGRMRGLRGRLRVAGLDVAGQARQVRQAVSVARVAGLVDLEGRLTVTDSLTERSLIDAVPTRRGADAFGETERTLGRTFPRDALVDDLPALDRTLLAVALATVRPSPVLLLDDADASLDLSDQRDLMAALLRLAGTGSTVVASTVETASRPPAAAAYSLSPRS